MAVRESRLFNLLSYSICGSDENIEGMEHEDTPAKIHNTCYELMQKDYDCEILKNSDGFLCSTYPAKLIVPIRPNRGHKIDKLKEYIVKGRFARTRGRFVVPVLMVNDKYICRSSTLARSPEIYYRRGYGYWVQGEDFDVDSNGTSENISNNGEELDSREGEREELYPNDLPLSSSVVEKPRLFEKSTEDGKNKEWLLDKIRNADINLLQYLRVDTIFDLMVEKKKVKFGMNVTSSEKVDRQQRYLRFKILSIPYPGCEFFSEYRKRNYCAEGLKFNWKQNFVDANLHVPENFHCLANITWNDYVQWDLVEITQNYLKLHLHSLMDENSTGILLHCISGWDRTPLFVSLMRLSLWADGIVHPSLNAEEIVYFTVAYDWLLFSHQFNARISNGEEIFFFCFDFLKYIYSDEYSMLPHSSGKKKAVNGENHKPMMEVNVSEASDGKIINEFGGGSKVASHGVVEGTEVKFLKPNGITHSVENAVAVMDVNESGYWNQNSHHMQCAFKCNGCHGENNGAVSTVDCTGVCKDPLVGITETFSAPIPRDLNAEKNDAEKNTGTLEDGLASKPVQEVSAKEDSVRKQKLKSVRDLLIPAYNAVIQCHEERHRESNSGFAASLFSQLTKTLSLVKR